MSSRLMSAGIHTKPSDVCWDSVKTICNYQLRDNPQRYLRCICFNTSHVDFNNTHVANAEQSQQQSNPATSGSGRTIQSYSCQGSTRRARTRRGSVPSSAARSRMARRLATP
eukprot:489898-Pleurochrysis_carterae.AAC.3